MFDWVLNWLTKCFSKSQIFNSSHRLVSYWTFMLNAIKKLQCHLILFLVYLVFVFYQYYRVSGMFHEMLVKTNGSFSYETVMNIVKLRLSACRSSRSQMFFKIGVLKNFAIFTGKHLCWSLLQACNFIKKRLQHRCFPVHIAKFSGTPFFTKHLR